MNQVTMAVVEDNLFVPAVIVRGLDLYGQFPNLLAQLGGNTNRIAANLGAAGNSNSTIWAGNSNSTICPPRTPEGWTF